MRRIEPKLLQRRWQRKQKRGVYESESEREREEKQKHCVFVVFNSLGVCVFTLLAAFDLRGVLINIFKITVTFFEVKRRRLSSRLDITTIIGSSILF